MHGIKHLRITLSGWICSRRPTALTAKPQQRVCVPFLYTFTSLSDTRIDINGDHEIFEDLGINYGSALDPSFDLNNFRCTSMSQNDPLRALSYEFALSGSVGAVQGHARQLSSGRQTPYSVPGLTGSPTSLASYAPITTAPSMNNLMGVYEPISELACTAGGPCLGEHGEIGFSTKTAGSPKRRYWLNESTAHMAPFTSSAHEQPTIEGFQFPSWDQLPEDLQNPTSSADFDSTIPITTTGVESTDTLPWDDMDFAMDLDTDMDMGLNQIWDGLQNTLGYNKGSDKTGGNIEFVVGHKRYWR
jgi:hypothetical protein